MLETSYKFTIFDKMEIPATVTTVEKGCVKGGGLCQVCPGSFILSRMKVQNQKLPG